jgi:peptidoglycan/LPS O-acetylase OafA/YrhL
VVSGYCIAATVDAGRSRPRAPLEFFRRRIRRIYPPYWAAFAASVLAFCVASHSGATWLLGNQDGFSVDPSGFTPRQWAGNLTLTEIPRRAFTSGATSEMLVGQAWSLCYEEQFYAVSGLILFLMPRRIFLGFAAVTGASLAVMGLRAFRLIPSPQGLFFDGKWLLFAVGVLVYHTVNHAGPALRRASAWLLVFGAAVPLLPPCRTVLKGLSTELVASCAFGAVLLALHRWDGRMARWRALRPLFACGEMCYSMYLVHTLVTAPVGHGLARMDVRGLWPTFALTVPLAVALSIALARLFYLGVERHFLNTRPQPAGAPIPTEPAWGAA